MPGRMLSRSFGKTLLRKIKEDRVATGAAALAFYSMLALFPAAIFVLTLLPYLPIPNLEQAIMDLLGQTMPPQAADLFTGTVKSVVSNRNAGLLSFGLLFTLWSASSGMYAAMQALDGTHDVVETRPFWKARGVALLLTLACAVLVVGAFALVVFGGTIQHWMGDTLGWSTVLLVVFAVVRWLVIGVALLVAIALVYRFGPDVDRKFAIVTPGTVFATIGLAAASIGFRVYVSGFAHFDKMYGSLGAVIVLLMWLFVAGLVLLVGSELDALGRPYRTHGNEERRAGLELMTHAGDISMT